MRILRTITNYLKLSDPDDLESVICAAIDKYHAHHQDLSIIEILNTLEAIRYTITEGMLDCEAKEYNSE